MLACLCILVLLSGQKHNVAMFQHKDRKQCLFLSAVRVTGVPIGIWIPDTETFELQTESRQGSGSKMAMRSCSMLSAC